jgi:hypothetical protein
MFDNDSSIEYIFSGKVVLKTAVIWDVAPCSLVDSDRRFRDTYCLYQEDDE